MFCQLLTLECAALQSAGRLDNLSPLVLEIHGDASRYHFSGICPGKGCFSEGGGSIWVVKRC